MNSLLKIIINFALCLGLAMPSVQPISRSTKIALGGTTLFAAHVGYEVNAAFKRACKARKRKIIAAKQKQHVDQSDKTAKPESHSKKELKPMTWKEFSATTKYLKKHLHKKNLLASSALLLAGGYYLSTKKTAAANTGRRNFMPDENTVPNTPGTPDQDRSTGQPTPGSPQDSVPQTVTPQDLDGAPGTSTPQPATEVTPEQRFVMASGQLARSIAEQKSLPRSTKAQQYLTAFLSKWQTTDADIVDLQAQLTQELLNGKITAADLRDFNQQLQNRYPNMLDDLIYLATHPQLLARVSTRDPYDFCLFTRIDMPRLTDGPQLVFFYQLGKQRSAHIFDYSARTTRTLFVFSRLEEQISAVTSLSLLSHGGDEHPLNIVSYHWAEHLQDLQRTEPERSERIRAAMTEDPEQRAAYERIKLMIQGCTQPIGLLELMAIKDAIAQENFMNPSGVRAMLCNEIPELSSDFPWLTNLSGNGVYQPSQAAWHNHQEQVLENMRVELQKFGIELDLTGLNLAEKKTSIIAALTRLVIEGDFTKQQLTDFAEQCGETQTHGNHILSRLLGVFDRTNNPIAKFKNTIASWPTNSHGAIKQYIFGSHSYELIIETETGFYFPYLGSSQPIKHLPKTNVTGQALDATLHSVVKHGFYHQYQYR